MNPAARIRHWLPLLPLLCLVGITYWLNQQVLNGQTAQEKILRHEPDAFMENFSAIKLNQLGVPRLIMTAKKLQHYADDDSTTLENPRLVMMMTARPAIHIIAREGVVSSKGDEVFLNRDVELLREPGATQEQLTVHTEYLHIVPDREWLDTDQQVTLEDAQMNLQATGLEMDNKARTLKLLSKVKSDYVLRKK